MPSDLPKAIGLGWGGILTLEYLAGHPEMSGLDKVVTRERIRQLEAKAERSNRKRGFFTPILDKAIKEVADHAPILVPTISQVIH